MSDFVSVVVPAYNEATNIQTLVTSIRKQDFTENSYELITVDNNSSDNTLDIIRQLGTNYTVEYKKGRAAAKNAGIKLAKGDYIVFIDADCVARPDWLRKIMSGFAAPDIGCVAGEIMPLQTNDSTPMEEFLIEKGHLSQNQHINHPFLSFAVTANAAYRKEVFQLIGLFDESMYGEDADFSWRMQLFTPYKVAYVPDAVVFHPYETSARNTFKQKQRHGYGSVMLYKKYKKYRLHEIKTIKQTYWEYLSIMRRWTKVFSYKLRKKLLIGKPVCAGIDERQLILETAWKVGLIHGSIRHRVRYL